MPGINFSVGVSPLLQKSGAVGNARKNGPGLRAPKSPTAGRGRVGPAGRSDAWPAGLKFG